MTKWMFHLGLLAAFLGIACAQVDVLTANYDNNRTNANLNEGILNTIDVNVTQFGRLYAFPVDGQIYAQPLYLHAFNMPGKGVLNVLYVATMHNSVYAFDADSTGGTAPLWQVNLGPSVNPLTIVDSAGDVYGDIQHEIGILSTPVIDRSGNTIYVVSEILQGGTMAFYLHALDLSTGSEKLNGPVEIQATVTGSGWSGTTDPDTGQLPFFPAEHIQRPGLLLANGAVYIGFGSHADFVPWHGWIMAYNASDIQQQTAVFCTTPSGAGVAVWQGGRGLAADPNGEVYAATGNGTYDGATAWGESVLHLTPALEVADWFTPAQYPDWTDDDADFGSNGPILVPGTNLLIAGGKAGLVALIDRTNMGHELAANTQALQTFQAVPAGQFAIYNAALWNLPDGPLLYIWGYEDVLRAFQMQNGVFNTTAVAFNSSVQQNYADARNVGLGQRLRARQRHPLGDSGDGRNLSDARHPACVGRSQRQPRVVEQRYEQLARRHGQLHEIRQSHGSQRQSIRADGRQAGRRVWSSAGARNHSRGQCSKLQQSDGRSRRVGQHLRKRHWPLHAPAAHGQCAGEGGHFARRSYRQFRRHCRSAALRRGGPDQRRGALRGRREIHHSITGGGAGRSNV